MLDTMTTPPTLSEAHGNAWLFDLPRRMDALGLQPGEFGQVSGWIVEASWAHPVWHSYNVLLCHLRPIKGKPAVMYLDGATHEILVYAVDPKASRQEMLDGSSLHWLLPCNFAAQFVAESDEAAAERVRGTVLEIVHGHLSPDTDFRQAWVNRYGDNMMKSLPGARRRPSETVTPFARDGA